MTARDKRSGPSSANRIVRDRADAKKAEGDHPDLPDEDVQLVAERRRFEEEAAKPRGRGREPAEASSV